MKKHKFKLSMFLIFVVISTTCLLVSCNKVTGPFTSSHINVTVSTLAGGGAGNPSTINNPVYGLIGSSDGMGTAASFYAPGGIAIDVSGNIYVGESGNHDIRKISPLGVVTTFAGNIAGGAVNGMGTAASFSNLQGIATDQSGNVYVADSGNQLIRKITPEGMVST